MSGLRRVSFQIAFMGLGLRNRASVERWCIRSTGVDVEAVGVIENRVMLWRGRGG